MRCCHQPYFYFVFLRTKSHCGAHGGLNSDHLVKFTWPFHLMFICMKTFDKIIRMIVSVTSQQQ